MRLLLDENVRGKRLRKLLTNGGHDAKVSAEQGHPRTGQLLGREARDDLVLATAHAQRRLLVTRDCTYKDEDDLGFEVLHYLFGGAHSGILVLVGCGGMLSDLLAAYLLEVLDELERAEQEVGTDLAGLLVVAELGREIEYHTADPEGEKPAFR